ncbi:MAG: outer membrane beta-barrel family protein [Bacteroidia bacterium]
MARGELRGWVFVAGEAIPLTYATVAVVLLPDSLLGGAATDGKGRFRVGQLPFDTVEVRIDFPGYYRKVLTGVVLTAAQPTRDLGVVLLDPAAYVLDSVNIEAERGFQELGLDRRIYNLSKLPLAEGAMLHDVLEQIPSVEVDIEGNLLLRGSGGVRILIDGRPSGLTGVSNAGVLKQIPAATVERVEVITTPSARFDPEGSAGIINIVTKKNRLAGLNGSASLSVGTNRKANGSLSLGYRDRSFRLSSAYDANFERRWGERSIYRSTATPAGDIALDQRTDFLRETFVDVLRPDIEFYLGEKNTLAFSGIINRRSYTSTEDIRYRNISAKDVFTDYIDRSSENRASGDIYDIELDYDRTFATAGRLLTLNLGYASFAETDSGAYNEAYFLPDGSPLGIDPVRQQTAARNGSYTLTGSLDYTHPLPKGLKLETGLKANYRTIDNGFLLAQFDEVQAYFVADPRFSNDYDYREQTYAAYGVLSRQQKRLGYQLGLRAEQTISQSEIPAAAERYDYRYFNLFPSLHLTYKTSKQHQWQASYARRIDRPAISMLNPYPTFTDPRNISFGNPDLLPAYVHLGELTHAKTWKKGSITSALYLRYIDDAVRRYYSVDSSGLSVNRFENIGRAYAGGLELIGNARLTAWWGAMLSVNAFRSQFDGSSLTSTPFNSGWGWSGKALSTLRFKMGLAAQVSFQYQSGRPLLQGSAEPIYWLDIALRQTVLQKKGTITLRVSDVFDTRAFTSELLGDGFAQANYAKLETRIGYLGFSYQFGTAARSKRKGPRTERESERGREGLDDGE